MSLLLRVGFTSGVVSGSDTAAPTLSSPTDTNSGGTGYTGSVSTNEATGTLYWVVSTSATPPTATQVKAGQIHTGAAATASGSQAVSGTGVQNVSGSGLTSETTYYIHYMHEDAATNQSTVASGDGLTTADVTAPTLSSPLDAANGGFASTGSVSTSFGPACASASATAGGGASPAPFCAVICSACTRACDFPQITSRLIGVA